jgi:hypothetical protein
MRSGWGRQGDNLAERDNFWYAAQRQRLQVYKDGEQWKQTESFGRDDLPLVIRVLDKAHDWIFDQAP